MSSSMHKKTVILLILLSIFASGCNNSSENVVDPEEIECYIAFNSGDNSFVKIVNTLNRAISAKMLLRHAISALIDERSCALIGVVAGVADKVEILECQPDGTCSTGRTKTVSFRLEKNETLTIIVDQDFFQ